MADDDDALDAIRDAIDKITPMGGRPGRIWRQRWVYRVIGGLCIFGGCYEGLSSGDWTRALAYLAFGVALINAPESQRDAYLTGVDETLDLLAKHIAQQPEGGPDDR